MDVKLLPQGSDTLDVQLEEEDIAVTQIVLEELLGEKDVAFAGAHTPHPLFRRQMLRLQTKAKNPVDTLLAGITKARKNTATFRDKAGEALEEKGV